MCGCSLDYLGVYSLRDCWHCTMLANWPSSVIRLGCQMRAASQNTWPRCAKKNGWSMPNHLSVGPKRCWLISAGTPSNNRLIGADANTVAFKWKDYRTKKGDCRSLMRLSTSEFIRRFLIHVLPDRFHRICHYGMLASSGRKANIAKMRSLLGAQPPNKRTRQPQKSSYSPSANHAQTVAAQCASSRYSDAARNRDPRAPPRKVAA